MSRNTVPVAPAQGAGVATGAENTRPSQNEFSSLIHVAQRTTLFGDSQLSRDPRIILLQGISSILYGCAALLFPALTLALFTSLFASFALLFGALSLSSIFSRERFSSAWWQLLGEGLLALSAGLIALLMPNATALFILYVVTFWALLSGMNQIISSLFIPDEFVLRATLLLNGLSLVCLGFFLYSNARSSGLLALVWVIALQAILNGIFMIFAAILTFQFRARLRAERNLPLSFI